MRLFITLILGFLSIQSFGQFPYVKKLNYPEQLATQVVYDMLTDSKGYIWLGTDKGLYRFNGRSFVPVPFNNTTSIAVSYLQEDSDGTVWCMNFYNQLFYYQRDTLRKFEFDNNLVKEVSTFNNAVVGPRQVWFNSLNHIFEFDKRSHKLLQVITPPVKYESIVSSVYHNNTYYAYTAFGSLYTENSTIRQWTNTGKQYTDFRFVKQKNGLAGLGVGQNRNEPIDLVKQNCMVLPAIDLPPDVYIFHAVPLGDDELWLCTQNGAYKWNKATGETRCYLPNQRVTDVIKDYQGNYWFSTLDNGVFACASLYNTLSKIYNDPLADNFSKLEILPSGKLIAGNSQGLMSGYDLENGESFSYGLSKFRETEFISYDSVSGLIISNRGVFRENSKTPVELMDYSKGVTRDVFGNLIMALFNGAYLLNDHFGKTDRQPLLNGALYEKFSKDTIDFQGRKHVIPLRQKRCLSVLSSVNKDCFWVGYEDGLYEYHYNGTINLLKDEQSRPVIAKSLQQQPNGSLVIGTSTQGVMIFNNAHFVKRYGKQEGLSSLNIRKVIQENQSIWVLTDEGLDRIDTQKNTITNYLEEYGLANTSINDFVLSKGKIIFATPAGIMVRYNLPKYFNFDIKFPLLKAVVNGKELKEGSGLPENVHDISFYFEALHYMSSSALSYQYRLKGIDTLWRPLSSLNNQIAFNRLAHGNYVFEIYATAGANYKSVIRRFSFKVPKAFWQTTLFLTGILLISVTLLWLILRQWKKSLLKQQIIREQLLKSQLVALRAQMNPHFLYNVLNTVQGLVYGNRKTEAGELLGNFSDLMRKTLQASDKQLLSLKDEIENIRLYLELEKARFDKDFNYSIEINRIEELSEIMIPSLLLQPFAENAVKHGLMHKPGEKKLNLVFEKSADGLWVVIDDNGVGRAQSMEINKRSQGKPHSFATAALTERMELFNRLYKQKIKIEIIDKADEHGRPLGTRIELFIPDYQQASHAL